MLWPFVLASLLTLLSLPVRAQSESFDVMEYVVEGNTRLKPLQIEEAVYPMLGPGKTLKDVEAAREALEKAYQAAGFVTVGVDIPEQSTASGVIRLKVVEGKIDRLSIKGTRYFAASQIREKLPELASGSVPNANVVKQELAQLNRSANRQVLPALKPGKTPGTVDVEVTVEDTLPISGSISLSNFRPASSQNALRLGADVRFENVGESVFGVGHTLSLGLMTTPQDFGDTRLLNVSYLIPVSSRATFMIFALRSNTKSIEPVGASLIQGKYSQIGLRYFHTLAESSGSRLSLNLGVDRKSNEQLVAQSGVGPIVYYPLSVGMSYLTGGPDSSWKLDGTWVTGIGGGKNADKEFATRRLGASADFAAFKLDLSNDRSIGSGLRLRSRLTTQLANSPLINLEQAIAGGYESVRGYFEAEQVGDRSLRASFELGYLAKTSSSLIKRLEWIGFLDTAMLSVISPAVGQQDRFYLSSAGVGARMRLGGSWLFSGDLAYPLRSSGQTHKGDWRMLAKVIYEY